MTIKEVVQNLNSKTTKGLQLTKFNGILTSTWVIYKRNDYFYYFDINERFVFDKQHRYTYDELNEEFKNCNYKVDMVL